MDYLDQLLAQEVSFLSCCASAAASWDRGWPRPQTSAAHNRSSTCMPVVSACLYSECCSGHMHIQVLSTTCGQNM